MRKNKSFWVDRKVRTILRKLLILGFGGGRGWRRYDTINASYGFRHGDGQRCQR